MNEPQTGVHAMSSQIILTPAEVQAGKYREWSPETNEFIWQDDGSCVVVPLVWWDDASYARYQGDSLAGDEVEGETVFSPGYQNFSPDATGELPF